MRQGKSLLALLLSLVLLLIPVGSAAAAEEQTSLLSRTHTVSYSGDAENTVLIDNDSTFRSDGLLLSTTMEIGEALTLTPTYSFDDQDIVSRIDLSIPGIGIAGLDVKVTAAFENQYGEHGLEAVHIDGIRAPLFPVMNIDSLEDPTDSRVFLVGILLSMIEHYTAYRDCSVFFAEREILRYSGGRLVYRFSPNTGMCSETIYDYSDEGTTETSRYSYFRDGEWTPYVGYAVTTSPENILLRTTGDGADSDRCVLFRFQEEQLSEDGLRIRIDRSEGQDGSSQALEIRYTLDGDGLVRIRELFQEDDLLSRSLFDEAGRLVKSEAFQEGQLVSVTENEYF